MLDTKISFYVPSTKDGQLLTDAREFAARTSEIAKQFGQWFGGFTITDGVGGWVADDGELVIEPVKVVSSYCEGHKAKSVSAFVDKLADDKRKEWGQEAISVEAITVDGGLAFI